MGLLYIKNWSPGLIPLLSLLTGLISLFGFINIGEIIKNNIKLEIYKYWHNIINLICGIFTFSLLIQVLSIIRLNNKFSLSTLFFLILLLSLKKIFKTNFSFPKLIRNPYSDCFINNNFNKNTYIYLQQIDELHYHASNEDITEWLNYYSLPWEGAIWPHMHYQFIGAPFYAVGLPDSLNVISI